MNFALSTGAASAFAAGAAGEVAGGLACASAPETISVLTAADIMRVFNMSASKRVCSVKEKRNFLTQDNSRAGSRVPRDAELRLERGQTNCALQHVQTAGNPMFGRCAFQFQIGKFSCSVFIVRGETRVRDAELAAEGDAAEVRPHLKPRSPIDAVRSTAPRGRARDCFRGPGEGASGCELGSTSTIP